MAVPFPSDEYCTALGRATVAWAILETGVDFFVALTFNGIGAPPGYPEIPRSLSKKVGYMRRFAALPSADAYRDRILASADEITSLKERRHAAIHGAAFAALPNSAVKLVKVTYTKTMHGSEDHHSTAASLIQLHNETVGAGETLLRLVQEMLTAFEDTLNQSPR